MPAGLLAGRGRGWGILCSRSASAAFLSASRRAWGACRLEDRRDQGQEGWSWLRRPHGAGEADAACHAAVEALADRDADGRLDELSVERRDDRQRQDAFPLQPSRGGRGSRRCRRRWPCCPGIHRWLWRACRWMGNRWQYAADREGERLAGRRPTGDGWRHR